MTQEQFESETVQVGIRLQNIFYWFMRPILIEQKQEPPVETELIDGAKAKLIQKDGNRNKIFCTGARHYLKMWFCERAAIDLFKCDCKEEK